MTYSPEFYAAERDKALTSAHTILTELLRWVEFESVVDFGCGSNAWLEVAQALGATVTLGIDSTGTDPDITADISQPYDLGRTFDLALCLEVGEHFAERYAENLVRNLVAASDVVLFSAAIPDQPGVNHINCQWPSWWARLFEAHGYFVTADIRSTLWTRPEVFNFYRQNLLLCSDKPLPRMNATLPLDAVHPDRVTPGWVGR